MFNDDITKSIAKAAKDVMQNSAQNDSLLSFGQQDAAKNIQDQVNNARTMDTRNSIIKDAMINSSDNARMSPAACNEFERIAKGTG